MRGILGRAVLLFALMGLNAAMWAADSDKAAFDTLHVSVTSTWAWNRTLTIKGDGTYTFQMQTLEKVPGEKHMQPSKTPYIAEYRLSAGHLQELTRLLAATEWLAAPFDKVPPTDVARYAMTLTRDGKDVHRTCHDMPKVRAYAGLVHFLRRLNRQEDLLFGTTERGKGSPFAGGLSDELDGIMGLPHRIRPYAPALDYHRLVPAYEKFLLNPKPSPKHATAATKLMGYLQLESQRANLEALAQGRTPVKSDYKVPIGLRVAAVDALGTMGARPSLETLEKAAADGPSLSGRVAEAIMSVPDRRVVPMLARLSETSRVAAWALIRKGREAEPAIIEILRQVGDENKGGRAAYHVIRAWADHWNQRPASPSPSPAVLTAVHDKVRSVASGGSLTGRYGIDLLRLAEDPFVVRDPQQEIEAFLSLRADPKQGDRLVLLGSLHFRQRPAPKGFLHAADQGLLSVKEVYVEDGWGWAHLSDEKGETHYGLIIDRNGGVWTIRSGRKLTTDEEVRRDLDTFMRSFPKAVVLVPGAKTEKTDLHARNREAVGRLVRRLMTAAHDKEIETLKRGSVGSVEGWVSAQEARELGAEPPAGWSAERLKAVVDELCDKVYTRNRRLMTDIDALHVTDNWAAAHMTGPEGKLSGPRLIVILRRTAKGWRLVDIADASGKLPRDMDRRVQRLAQLRNALAHRRQVKAKEAAAKGER